MARRGINPVEQHVEKIVVGISVLLFVLVVYGYVINTPVTAHVGSQPVSVGELDARLGDAAQRVAEVYRQADKFEPPKDAGAASDAAVPDMDKVVDALKTPPPMVSPVRWWPEIKKYDDEIDGPLGVKHGLTSIKAPTINEIYSGVTYAGVVPQPRSLPDSNPSTAMAGAGAAAGETVSQDVVWSFLRLYFDMQEQYEYSSKTCHYTREQANLILFLDVQTQRQQVFPDGSAGPWEDVNTYKTVKTTWPQAVTVREDGSLSQGDEQVVRALFAPLADAQQDMLYPLPQIVGGDPFPPYWVDWTPPSLADASTPGATVVSRPPPVRQRVRPSPRAGRGVSDRGSEDLFRDPGRGLSEPGTRGPTRGPAVGGVDREARIRANQALQEATTALREKRYDEAMRALDPARNVQGMEARVQGLEQQITAGLMKQQEEDAKSQAQKASEAARNAEIWVFDLEAPAGKTYRYRCRLVVFNVFAHPDCDRLADLKNLQDGGQVALVGEWSVPSAPVVLADSCYYFMTGGQPDKETANVDLFRFQQGRWFKDTVRGLGIGDAIGDVKRTNTPSGSVDVDYRTGHVVVDIATDPAAMVGSDSKGTKVGIKRPSSPVLVSMDPAGTVESRWAVVDRGSLLYKELDAKWKAGAEPSGSSTMPPVR